VGTSGTIEAGRVYDRQVVKALEERFEQLNALWKQAEAALKKIPLPVDCFITYDKVEICEDPGSSDPRPTGDFLYHLLGFVKSVGGWRICHVVTDAYAEDGRYSWKPITECPLDVRLEAAAHIGKLREAVLKKAAECVPMLDKAINELGKILAKW
jgi:hypothetical protein